MRVEDSKKNEAACICGDCPTFPGTGERLYCGRGKSAKKIRRNGCLCSACPVYADYDLSGDYFCAEGAA